MDRRRYGIFWRNIFVSIPLISEVDEVDKLRYVAVHALQGNQNEIEKKSMSDILITTGGMLLPLLTRVGHNHGHAH